MTRRYARHPVPRKFYVAARTQEMRHLTLVTGLGCECLAGDQVRADAFLPIGRRLGDFAASLVNNR
jgi:hypothetical protein